MSPLFLQAWVDKEAATAALKKQRHLFSPSLTSEELDAAMDEFLGEFTKHTNRIGPRSFEKLMMGPKLRVVIKTDGGEQKRYLCSLSDTIGEIKGALSRSEADSSINMRTITLDGKILADDLTLEDCGITNMGVCELRQQVVITPLQFRK